MTRRIYKRRFAASERPSIEPVQARVVDPVPKKVAAIPPEPTRPAQLTSPAYPTKATPSVPATSQGRSSNFNIINSNDCPVNASILHSPGQDFHPPGPGIGTRPGPAPALGRPGSISGDHGSWKNESCYSKGSKGWKPTIMSIGTAHICPGTKGPQSPFRPPNISSDAAGYNSSIFRNEADAGEALGQIGYSGTDPISMVKSFQRNWNRVTSKLAMMPDCFRTVRFPFLPQGTLTVDGTIGPNTLNALEVALSNQSLSPDLFWPEIVAMSYAVGSGYGKRRIYNAAEG